MNYQDYDYWKGKLKPKQNSGEIYDYYLVIGTIKEAWRDYVDKVFELRE